MKRNLKIAAGVLLLVLAVAVAGHATGALTAADIIARMNGAADGLKDLNAVISVQTYKNGKVFITQQMRLTLKQPDMMRLEYLEPEYLAGNVTLIVGNEMWMYIAAVDKWFEKDLAKLSPAEQPWLMFRNVLRDVRSELDDYRFIRLKDEGDAYHIRGVPNSKNAVYGRIDLWVNSKTFVPVRRVLYDVDGHLLADARFLDATNVANGVTLPLRIETYNAEGKLATVVSYVQITVNAGVPDELFTPPGGSND